MATMPAAEVIAPILDAHIADKPKDGCWLWTGYTAAGYGRIIIRGRSWGAHRLSWIVANGPIPDGLWVLHRCDVRLCVNPAHLFLGDHAANMADMVAKGRAAIGDRNAARKYPERRPSRRGERNGRAKLTADQVLEIRLLYEAGRTSAWRSRTHQLDLARRFGVTQAMISIVVSGKAWNDVVP